MKNKNDDRPFVGDYEAARAVIDSVEGLGIFINEEEYFTNHEIWMNQIIEKLDRIDGKFLALIRGESSVIGRRDYRGLKDFFEYKTRIPAFVVDTDGQSDYDIGCEKAWLCLFQTFTEKSLGIERGRCGLLGINPYDVGKEIFPFSKGNQEYIPYGLKDYGVEAIRQAGAAMRNYVLSPGGLKAARYLAKRFGVSYKVAYPVEEISGYEAYHRKLEEIAINTKIHRVLIIHQQVLAHSLRQDMRGLINAHIAVASCFMMDREILEPWDMHFGEEEDWIRLLSEGNYDLIIADPFFMEKVKDYQGIFLPLYHTAVSGRLLAFGVESIPSKDL